MTDVDEAVYDELAETCWIHQRRERIEDGWFKVCFECNHVYRTEAELLAEANAPGGSRTFEHSIEVWTCPLCAHDF